MALQHLRSSTANKRPLPAGMSDGQLAVNTNNNSPGLFFKDSNGALVKVGPVHVGTTAPNASPASGGATGNTLGEQWLDTSSSRYVFKIWDGTAWRSEDGEFVNASGDVMTGALGIIAGTAAAPGLYFSGDDNTGVYSPGADRIALGTSGQQRLAIDSSGRVLVGPGTAREVGGAVVPTLAVETLGQAASFVRNSADTSGGIIALGKSRGTAAGAVTAVQQDDILGEIRFCGANGTDLTSIGAHIRAEVAGEVGTLGDTTDMPSRLTFSTTPDGLATATQRLVIDSNGQIAAKSLGTAAAPVWSFVDDPNTGIYSPGADQVAISTGGTGRLFVDSLGRVNIGTTSEPRRLHVSNGYSAATSLDGSLVQLISSNGNAGDFAGLGILGGTAGGSFIHFGDTDNAGIGRIGYFHNDNSFRINTNGTEVARLDSSGRLGLGTSTPSGLFTASGSYSNTSDLQIVSSGNIAGVNLRSPAQGRLSLMTSYVGANLSSCLVGTGDNNPSVESFRVAHSTGDVAFLQKVGIGTTAPTEKLVINDSGASATAAMVRTAAATGNAVVRFNADDTNYAGIGLENTALVLRCSNSSTPTERVRIDNSGRVGIGTASPSELLHVSGGRGRFASSTNFLDVYHNGTAGVLETTGGANTPIVFATTGAERARIDSSGRLLLGTSSESGPSYLQIQGNTSEGATGGGSIRLRRGAATPSDGVNLGAIVFADNTSSDGAYLLAQRDGGTWSASSKPTRLVFSTTADGASSPTERMRINNAGDVLIGATAFAGTGISISSPESSGCYATSVGTGSRNIWRFANANGVVGAISTSGSTTTYATSSDYRLKENVVPLSGAIDRINQLKPSQFNFIADPTKTVDGFIAHEAQAIVPECVTGAKDEVDEEGNPVYQGIDQSKLVPLLTAALQEAIAKIETLEAKVAALEAA